MWFVPLIAAGISAAAGIYGQEKNRREQERLNKSNQAITNQNMFNNRRLEDQSKFNDYPYAGVPFRSMNFANGGMLNVGNDLIGLNSQGGTSGSHEQGDNIHLLNSSGQVAKIEPGEVVTDGNYALSKRNPTPDDSFATRYLQHKGESVSLLAASKRLPDIVKSNELRRLSEIEDAKAKLVKPEQEMFNETNNQPGYAGVETNEMQAGGPLNRWNNKLDKLRSEAFSVSDEIYANKYNNRIDRLQNKIDNYDPNSLSFKEGAGMYGSDIINAGLAVYEATRKPLKYPGAQLSPIPSVRRINPYGRIGNISNEVGKAIRDIDLSTSNSQVARAAKQNVMLAGMDAKNKFISDIEDKNIAIDNQSSQLNANINASNVAAINANTIGKYSVDEARRDNLTNMYSQIAASMSNKYIDQLNFKQRGKLDKEMNKINTESQERIASTYKTSMQDNIETIRKINDDPESELATKTFKTFDEFKLAYYWKDKQALQTLWDKYNK